MTRVLTLARLRSGIVSSYGTAIRPGTLQLQVGIGCSAFTGHAACSRCGAPDPWNLPPLGASLTLWRGRHRFRGPIRRRGAERRLMRGPTACAPQTTSTWQLPSLYPFSPKHGHGSAVPSPPRRPPSRRRTRPGPGKPDPGPHGVRVLPKHHHRRCRRPRAAAGLLRNPV